MKHLKKFRPAFWDHKDIAGDYTLSGFSFQRKWKLIVVFTSFIAILPLFIMNFVDYSLTRRVIEKELKLFSFQISFSSLCLGRVS